MICAQACENLGLLFDKTEPPSWLGESVVERYPKLASWLERGILTQFPTTTDLEKSDRSAVITNVSDTFDPTQDGFSPVMPRLSSITALDKSEEPIRTYCAHHLLLGLTVPEVKIIGRI